MKAAFDNVMHQIDNYERNGDIWKSIYAYNHADNYVMAVLELAEKIKIRVLSASLE